MNEHRGSCFIIYCLSIITALTLNITDWPGKLNLFAPDWVLLVLLFWSQVLPSRYGVLNGWLIGLFADVLTGKLLGQHALAYAIANYFSIQLHNQLQPYELFRHLLFTLFTLTLSHALISWTLNLHAPAILDINFWYPVFSGMLFWPLIYAVLKSLCLAFKVL